MKKYLFIALLISLAGYCQPPNYTIYDCVTLRAFQAVWDQPTDPAICYTTAIVTENWAKPTYNPTCTCFFNAATPEEQEAFEAEQQAGGVGDGDLYAVNTALTAEQTNTSLNNLYPYVQTNFRLTCKNVGTGMIYIKVSATEWKGTALFSLPNN